MSNRDDMVIRPTLEEGKAAAPVETREERRAMRGTRKKGRRLRKAAQAQAARRVARARGGGMMAWLPTTAAIVAAAVVAARLTSGRSFGGMGAEIKKAVLGDEALRAIARSQAMKQLMSHPRIMRVVSRTGSDNPQVRRLHASWMAHHYRTAKGAQLIALDKDFDANNALDVLIVRLGELTGLLDRVDVDTPGRTSLAPADVAERYRPK